MMIYVAGRYTDRARCRMVRATLVNRGYRVNSRWLYQGTLTPQDDIADVCRADTLVLVEPPGHDKRAHMEGGGRYVELGVALYRKMPVLVWQDRYEPRPDICGICFFFQHSLVSTYLTLPELVDALAAPAFRLAEGPIG